MSFQTGGDKSIYKRDEKNWAVGSRVKGDRNTRTREVRTRSMEKMHLIRVRVCSNFRSIVFAFSNYL